MAEDLGERLWGVRLDTSGTLVDKSLQDQLGDYPPTGVNPHLVRNVREALDSAGHGHVKIIVSGGFDAQRIAAFEEQGVPVDIYGVGSSLMGGARDFTADIVQVDGKPVAKVGRSLQPNDRLVHIPL